VIGSINSTSDAGNPGLHFGGSAPDGQLLITEVMFNPRSDESAGPDFEWIEVLNTTGATIDFSVTPYYFDDAAGGNLAEPNVTLGSIADLETAVLFSDGLLSIEDMEGIWGDTINFIPVSNWGALNNGTGDTVGLWDNQTAYAADEETGEEGVRGVTMAVASVVYRTDDTGGWPVPDGNGSIWLTDLSDDPTNGANWVVAAENDGFGISYNAMAIGDMVEIHPGGDIGSPGSFAMDPGGDVLGDYNEDGIVNAADYIVWRNNEGQNFALPNERPDASTPGVPDQEDYLYWVSQFGSTSGAASGSAAVPEPTAALLCVIAILGLSTTRSRRR
jgi:hypothetical protein